MTTKARRTTAKTSAAPPPREWEWFGHAAHFICSKDCRFHLATLVNGFLVSTVGELWPARQVREIHASVHDPAWLSANRALLGDAFDAAYFERFGFDTIGVGRTFETMVFRATDERCSTSGCGCGLPVVAEWSELDSRGYSNAGDARRGHMALCEKWAAVQPADGPSE